MTRHLSVRAGRYRDSVTLMQVSRDLTELPGIRTAFVAMATELNLDLVADLGFETAADPADRPGPNDMIVAIEGDDEAVAAAVARLDELLRARPDPDSRGSDSDLPPRSVRSAARRHSGAGLVLLSIPGPAVFPEAVDALDAGLSVMIFSDNVPVEHEIALKERARSVGQLVMGPDCGTAVLDGVGLGFANVVRPGPVSLVAASGTGAQQLMCLLDAAGIGVRHCLGVGGRDLSSQVAGRATHQAVDLLAADDPTELIVVVSKPPAPDVAESLRSHARAIGKPVIMALLGPGQPDLTQAAESVARRLGVAWQPPRWWPAPVQRTGTNPMLRGLFSGGTLCDEAMIIASETLGPIGSNIPLDPTWALPPDLRGTGHYMIDFGDDRLTRGRAHPMIDPTLRTARLLEEAADESCGVLLLDVVLGHAAHPDPAGELVPAIAHAHRVAAAAGREIAVVIALIGTAHDPQGLVRQAEALCAAQASVHLSNAAAAQEAVELLDGTP